MENYEEIYENHYKDLPTLISIITLCFFGVLATLDLLLGTAFFQEKYEGIIYSMTNTDHATAIFYALLFWVIVTFGMAFLVRYLVSVSISQKVVMTDALIEIRNKTR